ncbi:MAG: hypothetical protein ACI83O_000591 [Patescibacteria group bacterium]|jgi:uncharacterized protein (UPF0332 family)
MRNKAPDPKNALSILKAAKDEIDFTLTLKMTEQSSSTIIRNIYESFRMLGDAILVNKGISSEDHLLPIKELSKIQVKTTRPINLIQNLRKLRHNINYYGYKPNMIEVEDAISLTKSCFLPLAKEIQKVIDSK